MILGGVEYQIITTSPLEVSPPKKGNSNLSKPLI